ncbi:MAG: amino acid adenylation domain-containing protein [Proteobacteria bacterium]|nr:amino acid adenylation domain-containing protein [Pseudomonadota bacterium]MBU1714999.1 amino acid adenylation domain-containing protein [Pseudomonadota bacterium]
MLNKKIIHTVFEATVEKFPARIAIEEGERAVTFAALNQRANQLAATLLNQKDTEREAIIGIFLPPSIEYVESLLGIAKAGGVYLPLNLDFPPQRLTYILTETRPTLIITSQAQKDSLLAQIREMEITKRPTLLVLPTTGDHLELLDENGGLLPISGADHPAENPPLSAAPDDSCYLMYTSGSTGDPKAIVGCHKGLSHFVHWEISEFGLTEEVTVPLLAPTTFDVSLRDIFVPLITGGTLCIPDQTTRNNISRLLKWFNQSKVSLIHCVPSLLRLLLKELESGWQSEQILPELRHLLLAGEPLYGSDIIKWHRIVGRQAELVNLYGPSETTLAKAFNRLTDQEPAPNAMVPIGQPISNTALLIIKDNRLCGLGEIGEIHIKTPFMSKGYYEDPELSRKAFIQNPLVPDQADIIYKTGDLGRYLPDRSVEFIGRLDRQIKLNGIRIELAEIEKALLLHRAVEQTFVVAYKTGGHEETLACYFTGAAETETADLITHLQTQLPSYMVPSFFVRLDKFPLNINGKIDRKALPKPEELIFEKIKFEPPASTVEEEITQIWTEILGLAKVGVNNPFFQIGGNSLSAIRILSRIYKAFQVEISIKAFFENSTIRELARLIHQAEKSAFCEIQATEKQDYYDLSPGQWRLWVLDQMAERSIAYNTPEALLVEGDFDQTAFRQAFATLIERHEILRTSFPEINGKPRQQIRPPDFIDFAQIDLSAEPDPEKRAKEYVAAEGRTPFRLAEDPLLRMRLLKLSAQSATPTTGRFVLVLTVHHIISDGWSMKIMVQELSALYQAYAANQPNPLPPLPIQYRDYAAWLNSLLASDKMEEHKSYWHDKLSGEIAPLALPVDYPRPAAFSGNGKSAFFTLDRESTAGLRRLARASEASLFMVLLATLKTLIYRYTGQSDLIIGTPIAGRNHPDLEQQIGFYVNTLALRTDLHGEESFNQCLARVKETCTGAYEHEIYPFDRLVGELNLGRELNRTPLFTIMLAVEEESGSGPDFGNTTLHNFEADAGISRFELTFLFTETDGRITFEINYNTDIFSQERIGRMGEHFQELVKSIGQDPDRKIFALNILAEPEQKRLLEEFTATAEDYPAAKTIVELFEEQVAQTPDNQAVVFEERCLTYRQLNERVNQLAHNLRKNHGIRPDQPVGLMLERSEWLVIGLLAIIKGGGTYLPLDPAYPEERLNYILADSGCRLVLTEKKYLNRELTDDQNDQLTLVEINSALLGAETNPAPVNKADDLAYIIYTSGSTGLPKGVMIEHGAFINMPLDQIKSFNITANDRCLQFASSSFDASVYEIFIALFSGASLVMISQETISDPARFVKYLTDQVVTMVVLPPVYLNTLAANDLPTVKTMITAGEAAIIKDALDYSRGKQYINAYGPTEASVCVTYHKVDADYPYPGAIPIGKPIANTRVHIVDKSCNPVPIGFYGEICLSGAGLARGYLNRPELTAEKFIASPFYSGERLYRTGDTGRWLEDGNIEWAGRQDDQLKVRGYRIEPGEIEARLREYGAVQEVVVVHKEVRGTKELTAYVTGKGEINVVDLREQLASTLPAYMIPTYFVQVEKLPLTPSGKIDKKSLPEPSASLLTADRKTTGPQNEIQRKLIEIWETVLGRTDIGINDNYFTLGGDSIKAIQTSSRLNQEKLRLEIKDLFRYPTIAELSGRITLTGGDGDQGIVSGPVPLTAIQEWFFREHQHDLHHFNQAVMLQSKDGLQPEALRAVLKKLLAHHDALRMTYKKEAAQMIQENGGLDYPLHFEVIDLRDQDNGAAALADYTEELQAGFKLASGPLMKTTLFRLPDGDRLLIIIHHLVIDGVSWRILLEDLKLGYRQANAGEKITFPAKTTSFKLWAEKIQQYASSAELEAERDYWQSIENAPLKPLQKDFPVADPVKNKYGDMVSRGFVLTREETGSLLAEAHRAFNTEINDLLLTALLRAMQQWQGSDRLLLGLEGHGRQEIFDGLDLSRTVGWFTSLYPVLLALPANDDLGYQIKQVKETLRKTPNKGVGYGILRYMGRNQATLTSSPQIIFNYLGQFDDDLQSDFATMAEESTGTSVSPAFETTHDLCISSIVLRGVLDISVTYNRHHFKPDTIEGFNAIYATELRNIISHCLSRDSTEITPSDIDYDGLNIDELQNVLAGLDN